jgi:glycosidase
VRQHVGYLKDLGVGALWITPLPRQVPLRNGACGYHGYWADETLPDDGAMEPTLGTLADVAGLREDLHAAGMKLVVDMVVNHAGRGARIAMQAPAFFHDDATCAALGDPVVACSLRGLPDYAQGKPEVARYLTAMSRGWVERVRPDGIRMDTAKHVPPGYFASSFVPAVRAAIPRLFLVAEYFDDADVARVVPTLDAGFDSAFDFPLRRALVDAFARGGSVDGVAAAVARARQALGEARASRLVAFLDNHDLPRFLSEASARLSDAELWRRYALALVALFTLPEIPQLYQGDELAAVGDGAHNRPDMPAWSWDAATRAGTHAGFVGDAQATWALVQRLAAMRAQDAALWRGTYVELRRQGAVDAPASDAPNAIAFERSVEGGADRVVVVLSNDTASRTVTVPLAAGAAWRDGTVLRDVLGLGAPAEVTVSGGALTLAMPALTPAVYRASPSAIEGAR